METVELSKRFIRYWQTSDWESFDNLLGENVELELPWLITTIKFKNNFILFFRKTKKANSSLVFELEKFVGNDKHSIITGISYGKNGIFCAPNVNLEDNAVHYYTSNAGANWVFNFRGGVSTTLNTMLATGEVMTVALLTTQGSTAYYATGIQIDGVSQTVKWSNGTAPSSGTANSIEVYSFSIVKTGNATYSVIGSVSDYS